jgi:hypothetical protein
MSPAQRKLLTLLALCVVNAFVVLYVGNDSIALASERFLELPQIVLRFLIVKDTSALAFSDPIILCLLVLVCTFISITATDLVLERLLGTILLIVAFIAAFSLIVMKSESMFYGGLIAVALLGAYSTRPGISQMAVATLMLLSLFVTLGDRFAFGYSSPLLQFSTARGLQDVRLIMAELIVVCLLVAAAYAAIREIASDSEVVRSTREAEVNSAMHWIAHVIILIPRLLAIRTVRYAKAFWQNLVRLFRELFERHMVSKLLRASIVMLVVIVGAGFLVPARSVLVTHIKTDFVLISMPTFLSFSSLVAFVLLIYALAVAFSGAVSGLHRSRQRLAEQLADFPISLLASTALVGLVAKTLTWIQVFPLNGFNSVPVVTVLAGIIFVIAVVAGAVRRPAVDM